MEFNSREESLKYLGYVPIHLVRKGIYNYQKCINGSDVYITVINYDYYFIAVSEGIHASSNTDKYHRYFELARTQKIDKLLKN